MRSRSDSTAFRVIDRIAGEPGSLDALRAAHARARERFWERHGAPLSLTIDVDATLITAHSEKEHAAGNYKGGYGFHPLAAYADETREALGGLLRPGNAGANTAADHQAVLDRALEQIPAEHIESLRQILVRSDSAGATHALADYCRDANMRFSVGYELTEQVLGGDLQIPEDTWVVALEKDGSARENGQVAEITGRVELSAWPQGSRLIVRRERPHPGAQLSFTDRDGYRFQAILTDQADNDIAVLECRHRQHAHIEDRIRDDKDTGLAKFPFKEFALNEVWLEIVMLAHDLIVWTQALLLDGQLAKAEPKRKKPGSPRRRTPRILRAAREAPPTRNLALGHQARRSVHEAQNAPSAHRLHNASRPTHQSSISRPRPRSLLPANRQHSRCDSLNRPRRPPPRATTPHSTAPGRRARARHHIRTLIARSGLA